jgi:phage tail-like protein
MDANGTRLHLLLGEDDWLGAGADSPLFSSGAVEWDRAHGCLTLERKSHLFKVPRVERALRPEDRRGADRDIFGNWYWLDETGREIVIRRAGTDELSRFWSSRDETPSCGHRPESGGFRPKATPGIPTDLQMGGLVVTDDHYLVAGSLDPGGLLVFDLHGGGPPLHLIWPDDIPFAPFDIAASAGGGFYVLDRTAKRCWRIDRYFRVVPINDTAGSSGVTEEPVFRPCKAKKTNGTAERIATGISVDMAVSLKGLNPVALETLPDGSVLMLTYKPGPGGNFVYRLNGKPVPVKEINEELKRYIKHIRQQSEPAAFTFTGHDFAFSPKSTSEPSTPRGTLHIVGSDGNQTVPIHLEGPNAELSYQYFPMRHFSGKALVRADSQAYYDVEDRWLSLVDKPVSRFKTEGRIETREFDGKKPGCIWHRLFIDACIPPGSKVEVMSRTADDRRFLEDAAWRDEPVLYRRSDGPELPYYNPFRDGGNRPEELGTWELLFQQAEGRYLQLKLTLRGPGARSPQLYALRAYYPRFSYMREYLPALYQADRQSASFLDRYLSNMEGINTVVEGRVACVERIFDVDSAPAEYLEWLGTWLGIIFDTDWEDSRKRLFLDHAVELFGQRGTIQGLMRAVHLGIDAAPDDTLFEEALEPYGLHGAEADPKGAPSFCYRVRIVEDFLLRDVPGIVYGIPTRTAGPGMETSDSEWSPEDGAAALHRAYREFLMKRCRDPKTGDPDISLLNKSWGGATKYESFDAISFSPTQPLNPSEAEDWRSFARKAFRVRLVGVGAKDREAYQDFLARRYGHLNDLKTAYGLQGDASLDSFGKLKLPGEDGKPYGDAQLKDWVEFVSFVLLVKRSANRFTVLVPIDPGEDVASRRRKVERVTTIVAVDKPAHTSFEVQPYWALFRVGEARLGLDTLCGAGSRFVATVLGASYLAESLLTPSHPQNVRDRMVSDRDRIGQDRSM